MFCHLGTLWLPTWFSAKIFACDCSLGKKNVLKLLWWLKTQERHAVPALFLHLPWFSSYLQHCPKTENWLMIKHYRWVLQRRWNNWILPSRYGVLLTFSDSSFRNIWEFVIWFHYGYANIRFNSSCQQFFSNSRPVELVAFIQTIAWKSIFFHNSMESLHFLRPAPYQPLHW